jgi:hypothetical protein
LMAHRGTRHSPDRTRHRTMTPPSGATVGAGSSDTRKCSGPGKPASTLDTSTTLFVVIRHEPSGRCTGPGHAPHSHSPTARRQRRSDVTTVYVRTLQRGTGGWGCVGARVTAAFTSKGSLVHATRPRSDTTHPHRDATRPRRRTDRRLAAQPPRCVIAASITVHGMPYDLRPSAYHKSKTTPPSFDGCLRVPDRPAGAGSEDW